MAIDHPTLTAALCAAFSCLAMLDFSEKLRGQPDSERGKPLFKPLACGLYNGFAIACQKHVAAVADSLGEVFSISLSLKVWRTRHATLEFLVNLLEDFWVLNI